jgi:hypothetical protein
MHLSIAHCAKLSILITILLLLKNTLELSSSSFEEKNDRIVLSKTEKTPKVFSPSHH